MRACLCQKLDTSDWQSNGPKRLVGNYAVRPPVYSIVYDEKLVTSLTPVNPDVRGRILSSNLGDVRINQEGVEGGKLFS